MTAITTSAILLYRITSRPTTTRRGEICGLDRGSPRRIRRYALQIWLGLGTCDAGLRNKRTPEMAAQHDRFLSRYVLPILHEKLGFCMTQKWRFWVPCMTDLTVMLAEHDKPGIFPDPDIFAMHKRRKDGNFWSTIRMRSFETTTRWNGDWTRSCGKKRMRGPIT